VKRWIAPVADSLSGFTGAVIFQKIVARNETLLSTIFLTGLVGADAALVSFVGRKDLLRAVGARSGRGALSVPRGINTASASSYLVKQVLGERANTRRRP
jgi:hypothetical protein